MEVWHSVLMILGALVGAASVIVKTLNDHKSDHKDMADKLKEISEILDALKK